MVGVFISPWGNLLIEAVTVWIFSSLIILSYEYTKVILHRDVAKKVLAVKLRSSLNS